MRRTAALLAAVAAWWGASAHAGDPTVPIGQDPGGTAVAVVVSGIDYVRPESASALARDGEGEIIAWDFVDHDNRPYAAAADMYETAILSALAVPGIRIVPIRVSFTDPLWLAKAATFAARTPATIIVTPLVAADAELNQLTAVSKKFASLQLFVIPAGVANTSLVESATTSLANVSVLGEKTCTSPHATESLRSVVNRLCALR